MVLRPGPPWAGRALEFAAPPGKAALARSSGGGMIEAMSIHDYSAALQMLQEWVGVDPRRRSFQIMHGHQPSLMRCGWAVSLWSTRWRVHGRERSFGPVWHVSETLVQAAMKALDAENRSEEHSLNSSHQLI